MVGNQWNQKTEWWVTNRIRKLINVMLPMFPRLLFVFPLFSSQCWFVAPFFLTTTGLELTDDESRFAIHFDYFAEHFFLIFMKLPNKFLLAHPSFKIVKKYHTFHNKLHSKNYFICPIQSFLLDVQW